MKHCHQIISTADHKICYHYSQQPNSDAARLKQTKAEFEDSRKQTDLCIQILRFALSYEAHYRKLMELQAENRGLNEQLQAKNTENDSLKDTIRLLQAEIQEREQTVIDLTNEEEV